MMDRGPPRSARNPNNQPVRTLGLVLRNSNESNDQRGKKARGAASADKKSMASDKKKPVGSDKKKPASEKKLVPGAAASDKKVLPTDKNGQLIEGTFETPAGTMTVRKIEPAKEYNVLSVARAMNPDLAKGVKKLFDPELEAAQLAIQTGLYLSWRPKLPPYDRQDCQRIGPKARCFCDHNLEEHAKFTGIEVRLKCEEMGCTCKAFEFVPSRPEEVGEFWLRRRRNFDPETYRCSCRCKHTHVEHDPVHKRCRYHGCGCQHFNSSSVCAACDKHTEEHETKMETEAERVEARRPVGKEWLPFAEISTLKNMVLTGVDDGGSMDRDLAPPPEKPQITANSPAPRPREVPSLAGRRKGTNSDSLSCSSSSNK